MTWVVEREPIMRDMEQELLTRLRQLDPVAGEVWEAFFAIEKVYREALRAMGLVPQVRQDVTSSADVRVSVSPLDRVA